MQQELQMLLVIMLSYILIVAIQVLGQVINIEGRAEIHYIVRNR